MACPWWDSEIGETRVIEIPQVPADVKEKGVRAIGAIPRRNWEEDTSDWLARGAMADYRNAVLETKWMTLLKRSQERGLTVPEVLKEIKGWHYFPGQLGNYWFDSVSERYSDFSGPEEFMNYANENWIYLLLTNYESLHHVETKGGSLHEAQQKLWAKGFVQFAEGMSRHLERIPAQPGVNIDDDNRFRMLRTEMFQ
ncbi:hypothetical protein CYMTET_49109 [Cymbomonas tetramitiformis]|uniref:Uncharacterized protein n=1 Tax=Cymbomonas tetramitiformis TaxID=36881 RepID=A0AAE0BS48_9CHLO|nr:hypothetical protein CYMTET_49109 [Cymbomonas tetramitiformis]